MPSVMLKRALIAGGAAAVLGGAAIGVAFAQQTPTPTRTPGPKPTAQAGKSAAHEQQFLDALAKRLNTTTDKLKQAIQDARKDAGLPDRGGFGGFGPTGKPGFGKGPAGLLGPVANTAAKAIGITADQLHQELAGKSLSDVAKAHNVEPKKVADALKADLNAHVDQAAAAKHLSADQAAQAKQRASDQIDQMMTHQMPQRPATGQPAKPGNPGQPGQPGQSGPRRGPVRGFAPGPAGSPI